MTLIEFERRKRNLNQRELSKQIGISMGALSFVENRDARKKTEEFFGKRFEDLMKEISDET